MSEAPPRFEPLVRPPRSARILVALGGPLLWVIGFAVLAVVTHETGTIAIGVTVAAISFAVSIVVVVWTQRRRIREEEEGPPAPDR